MSLRKREKVQKLLYAEVGIMNFFKSIKRWWRKKQALKVGYILLEPEIVILNKDAIARVEIITQDGEQECKLEH